MFIVTNCQFNSLFIDTFATHHWWNSNNTTLDSNTHPFGDILSSELKLNFERYSAVIALYKKRRQQQLLSSYFWYHRMWCSSWEKIVFKRDELWGKDKVAIKIDCNEKMVFVIRKQLGNIIFEVSNWSTVYWFLSWLQLSAGSSETSKSFVSFYSSFRL